VEEKSFLTSALCHFPKCGCNRFTWIAVAKELENRLGDKKKKELKEPEWGRLLFVAAFSD